MMIPDSKNRLQQAVDDLRSFVSDNGEDLGQSQTFEEAKTLLAANDGSS